MARENSKELPSSSFVEKGTPGLDTEVLDVGEQIQRIASECPPFYRNRNLFILYLLMIPGCLVPAITLGFDAAMMNGLQAVPSWDDYFNRPRGSLLGIMSAILPLGCVLATPFVSVVGDRWGRRVGIIVGSVIMVAGGVIQGASVHIGMFMASRFIIGVGIVFANAFAPMLIAELAHPKERQVITSLYQTSWYIGAIIAAWVTFGTFSIPNEWSWRIPSLLQAAPALLQIGGVLCLPESPRWLVAKGRAEEAKAVLVKYHANGDANDEFVNLEFEQMRGIIEAEVNNETGWKAFFDSPGNRKRLVIIICLGVFSQWSGNGLVSYYLVRVLETVGITESRDKNIINGCLMIFNWITSVASAFLTARLKRRTQFLTSGFGMLAVFTAQTLCAGLFNERHNIHAGKAVIAMLFLFYFFFNLAFNALLYSYPVEVLPYPIRAKGFSLLMFFGKASNFINILVNPIGLQAIGWRFYLVYVAWLCIEIALMWKFFVETKGPSLEAIAALFDGEHVKAEKRDFIKEKGEEKEE
ncbi:related to hexose transporter protein [Cephalotrichum gorgonifer]|uniref:Related to hexose transporter protein n=1 Tax=Cephalotrichum gorgonifer TaxID=2041049 RepID=A0AAE8MW47_9PEZI|nr:related to hexose transporter protein [Cephalotrichum gorgonifer]